MNKAFLSVEEKENDLPSHTAQFSSLQSGHPPLATKMLVLKDQGETRLAGSRQTYEVSVLFIIVCHGSTYCTVTSQSRIEKTMAKRNDEKED